MVIKQCFYCGEEADDYEEIGRTKLWVCNNRECRRELRHEGQAYEAEVKEKAHEDNFDRYR